MTVEQRKFTPGDGAETGPDASRDRRRIRDASRAGNRNRARDAALAAAGRDRRSLTARLLGDPERGRSALDRAAAPAPEITSRIPRIDLRPCPLLAVELIDALDDGDDY